MTIEKEKETLIGVIMNYLRDEVIKSNKDLVRQKRYQDQKSFNEGDMFFKLAFLDISAIRKIAHPICGC